MELASNKERAASRYSLYWNNLKEFVNLMTNTYRVVPAVTQTLEREAYKIRHKVYCQELQYEDGHAKNEESDQYDAHSTQIVVHSKSEASYVGCIRMVHGRHAGRQYTLPLEHHCHGKLNMAVVNMVKESGHRYAEVSRLAIDKEFRHIGRRGRTHSAGIKSKSSVILLSLYLGLYSMAQRQGVRYLFAIVEPRLLKNLHSHSVPAIQIGDGVDHRGLRVPILIDVHDIERAIPKIMRPLYNSIKKEVSKVIAESASEAYNETRIKTHDIPDMVFHPPANLIQLNRVG